MQIDRKDTLSSRFFVIILVLNGKIFEVNEYMSLCVTSAEFHFQRWYKFNNFVSIYSEKVIKIKVTFHLSL